ncbi:MAG: formate dehydrogenase [Kiloniellales bacterium]|nr:formate dehydrogenase [Kiloniellales bacterium]
MKKQEKQKETSLGRRDFFRKAGLGAGAAGVAAVGLAAGKAAAAEPAVTGAGAAGYRETAHVKKYYELSRF